MGWDIVENNKPTKEEEVFLEKFRKLSHYVYKGVSKVTKGERLKQLRLSNKYTLEEIGKKINVAKQTYFKYENNIITIK